jgi:DNA invertase Pin-like site-specific DNA recombinase
MPETFLQRADALRARARQEHDHGRVRYLRGLASAYQALAESHGEPAPPVRPPRAKPPERIERAALAVELRDQGLSQRAIAERIGCSKQLISKIRLGGCD